MTKTIFSNEYKGLITWLKAERIKANLTIRDLAKELGVVHSYVGRIETLERRLDVWEYITDYVAEKDGEICHWYVGTTNNFERRLSELKAHGDKLELLKL